MAGPKAERSKKTEVDAMSKCPKCSKEIDMLNYSERCTRGGKFYIDPRGFEIYDERWLESNDSLIFSCPECDKTMFEDNQDAAIEFLKGGKLNVRISGTLGNKCFSR